MTESFHRDDEDWLLAHGVAPYSQTELDEAAQRIQAAWVMVQPAFTAWQEAVKGTVKALSALADACLEAEVDECCEAAILLDPGAPCAVEIAEETDDDD